MKINNHTYIQQLLVLLVKILFVITRLTNGKGYGFIMRQLRKFAGDILVSINLNSDSVFFFNIFDDYWNQLLMTNYSYEPEIHCALELLKDKEYCFIDAGANQGYWSVLASSDRYGKKKVISIEGSSSTYKVLKTNCNANNRRFQILNRAISSKDNTVVRFTQGAHAARHIDPAGNSTDTEAVKTITLSTIIDRFNQFGDRFVIKLDVEGAEISALQGVIQKLDECDVLFIYEDHGNDPCHRVSQYFINSLDFNIFAYSKNKFYKIKNVDELDSIKKNSNIGYNFLAFSDNSHFHNIIKNFS